jgi:hypothetical protein
MEELYPSSGFYPVIEQHERTVVTSTYSEDNCAVSQLGAVEVPDMTAKIIVVGNYVYVGSVNLDYNSIHCNRELRNNNLQSRHCSLVRVISLLLGARKVC